MDGNGRTCKDEPVRVNAEALGLAQKAEDGHGRVFVEPEDRVRDSFEDVCPDSKNVRSDAPEAIEGTIHHGVFGQAVCAARGLLVGTQDLGIEVLEGVGLIAVGHVDEFLCEEVAVLIGAHGLVHNIVVEVRGTMRSWKR